MPVGLPEFVENPENRCPVILLLDTSGSMSGQPIQELNRGLAAFKDNGVHYYRPWVFLITDGAPTDAWEGAAQRVREEEEQRRMLFFTVGVQGADMNKLRQIAPPERPPVTLNGLDFRSLFVWLSTSMKRVSSGKVGEAVALPPVGWGQITT